MSDEKERPASLLRMAGRGVGKLAASYPRAIYRAVEPDLIHAEAANIRRLWAALRVPKGKGVTLVTQPDGTIDIPLTAEVAGTSIEQVEAQLAMRLRRTAYEFWAYVLIGTGWLAIWMLSALFAPNLAGWWSGAVTALLVITLGAKALEAALTNWQVRALTLGGLGKFLSTADTILPRMRGAVRPR